MRSFVPRDLHFPRKNKMAASELDGMYLENLDEFVHDEGKVVSEMLL